MNITDIKPVIITDIQNLLNNKNWYSLFWDYSEELYIWFNPETFDWNYGYLLTTRCYNKFQFWWNPDYFKWDADSFYLETSPCCIEFSYWFWTT